MNKKYISIIIVLALILIGLWSYILFNNSIPVSNKIMQRGNMSQMREITLTSEQKDEINVFFSSNKTLAEKEEYCNENRPYCAYYCIEENSTDEICQNMGPRGPRGNFTR